MTPALNAALSSTPDLGKILQDKNVRLLIASPANLSVVA